MKNALRHKHYICNFLALIQFLCIFNLSLEARIFTLDRTGTTTANFLKIPIGARAVGMGGAYTGISDDMSSVCWNPAGLNQLRLKSSSFMHLVYLEDVSYDFLSFAIPVFLMGMKRTIGGSIQYLNMDRMDIYKDDVKIKSTKPYQSNLTFSYAQMLRPFMVGLNLKLIEQRIDVKKAQGFAIDTGILYKDFREKWGLGLNIQNIGPKIKFNKEKDPLPFNIKIGSFYKFNFVKMNPEEPNHLILSSDVNFPVDNDPNFHFGIEYSLSKIKNIRLAIRSGYQTVLVHSLGWISGISAGCGIKISFFDIDYAFRPYGGLGQTHWISCNIFLQRQTDKNKIIEKHYLSGKYYFQQGELAKAKDEFEKIIVLDSMHRGAGEFLKRISQKFDTITDVKSVYNHGYACFEKGEYDRAINVMEWVLSMEPQHPCAEKLLPLAKEKLLKQRKEEEKRKKKKLAESLYKKGLELYNKGLYWQSIEKFQKLLKVEPNYKGAQNYINKIRHQIANSFCEKGIEFFEKERWKKAVEKFKVALRYIPTLQKAKDYTEKALKNIKEKRQTHAEKLYQEGLGAYNKGEKEKGLILLKEAKELIPDSAKIIKAIERIKEELRILKKDQNKQRSKYLYEKGLNAYMDSKKSDALKLWQEALSIEPTDKKIQRALERVKEELQILQEK